MDALKVMLLLEQEEEEEIMAVSSLIFETMDSNSSNDTKKTQTVNIEDSRFTVDGVFAEMIIEVDNDNDNATNSDVSPLKQLRETLGTECDDLELSKKGCSEFVRNLGLEEVPTNIPEEKSLDDGLMQIKIEPVSPSKSFKSMFTDDALSAKQSKQKKTAEPQGNQIKVRTRKEMQNLPKVVLRKLDVTSHMYGKGLKLANIANISKRLGTASASCLKLLYRVLYDEKSPVDVENTRLQILQFQGLACKPNSRGYNKKKNLLKNLSSMKLKNMSVIFGFKPCSSEEMIENLLNFFLKPALKLDPSIDIEYQPYVLLTKLNMDNKYIIKDSNDTKTMTTKTTTRKRKRPIRFDVSVNDDTSMRSSRKSLAKPKDETSVPVKPKSTAASQRQTTRRVSDFPPTKATNTEKSNPPRRYMTRRAQKRKAIKFGESESFSEAENDSNSDDDNFERINDDDDDFEPKKTAVRNSSKKMKVNNYEKVQKDSAVTVDDSTDTADSSDEDSELNNKVPETRVLKPKPQGVSLRSFPQIVNSITSTTDCILQRLHVILFGTSLQPELMRQNILDFNGFPFNENSEEWAQKHFFLSLSACNNLVEVFDILHMKIIDDSPNGLVNSLMQFLLAPRKELLKEGVDVKSPPKVPVKSKIISPKPKRRYTRKKLLMTDEEVREMERRLAEERNSKQENAFNQGKPAKSYGKKVYQPIVEKKLNRKLRLGDNAHIRFMIVALSYADLDIIQNFLFLHGSPKSRIRRSILEFDGFDFKEDNKRYDIRKNILSKLGRRMVKRLAFIFGLAPLETTKTTEALSDIIMKFLMAPHREKLVTVNKLPENFLQDCAYDFNRDAVFADIPEFNKVLERERAQSEEGNVIVKNVSNNKKKDIQKSVISPKGKTVSTAKSPVKPQPKQPPKAKPVSSQSPTLYAVKTGDGPAMSYHIVQGSPPTKDQIKLFQKVVLRPLSHAPPTSAKEAQRFIVPGIPSAAVKQKTLPPGQAFLLDPSKLAQRTPNKTITKQVMLPTKSSMTKSSMSSKTMVLSKPATSTLTKTAVSMPGISSPTKPTVSMATKPAVSIATEPTVPMTTSVVSMATKPAVSVTITSTISMPKKTVVSTPSKPAVSTPSNPVVSSRQAILQNLQPNLQIPSVSHLVVSPSSTTATTKPSLLIQNFPIGQTQQNIVIPSSGNQIPQPTYVVVQNPLPNTSRVQTMILQTPQGHQVVNPTSAIGSSTVVVPTRTQAIPSTTGGELILQQQGGINGDGKKLALLKLPPNHPLLRAMRPVVSNDILTQFRPIAPNIPGMQVPKPSAVATTPSVNALLPIRPEDTGETILPDDGPQEVLNAANEPTDHRLFEIIRDTIHASDLSKLTLKGIISKLLSEYPKLDVAAKRPFIKDTVRDIICGTSNDGQ